MPVQDFLQSLDLSPVCFMTHATGKLKIQAGSQSYTPNHFFQTGVFVNIKQTKTFLQFF